ncbi:RNA-binding protein [Virgibacillus sp. NKC19-3]|uniref:YlmH family RNA-binding protein n=1 Tax=Virgibacillus saliphilus TaxID=2831674 RepID=UPI001C9B2751|nr:RNA-binding protein [Virgibacillus sp. NKC19-3]MBY7143709.1 RNA-binding protein [Virgibacillus sp. NKC19-3]
MDIYQHFRKEEQPFIDKVLAWVEQVEATYQLRVTDFLDPREQQIMHLLVGENSDVSIHLCGGGPYAERKRAVILPPYEEIAEEVFQLTLVQAAFQSKFISLEHRDVMGAFLSLGIKRKKLGDIIVEDGVIQIVMAKEIAPFVLANLTAIKKANVKLVEKPFTALMEKDITWMETDQTVSSLRLDAVLTVIYNISRKDAAEFIKKLQVKVNFKVVDDAKFLLQEGDLLSVRGKGRSKLVSVNGQTKKNKWRITTAILK